MDKLETTGYVRLEWVRVEGREDLQRCSDFITVPRRLRPTTYCPGCKERVFVRAGPRRRPHGVHHSGSRCTYSSGDNALHENAKFHLAEQLWRVSSLWFRVFCCESDTHNGMPCRRAKIRLLASGWDTVVPERTIEHRRPDIVLLKNGVPVAAIEVYVSHEVDAEKRSDLDAYGVPWIEVSASDIVGARARKVVSRAHQLPARAYGPGEDWRCGKCRVPPTEKKQRPPKNFDPLQCLNMERRDRLLEAAWSEVSPSRDLSDKPKGFCRVAIPEGDGHHFETFFVKYIATRRDSGRYVAFSTRRPAALITVAPRLPLREQAADALKRSLGLDGDLDYLVPWTSLEELLPSNLTEFRAWVEVYGLPRWWRKAHLSAKEDHRHLNEFDLARRIAWHAAGGHKIVPVSRLHVPDTGQTSEPPTPARSVLTHVRPWARSPNVSPNICAIA